MSDKPLHILRVFPAFQETLKYAEHHLAERLSAMGHRLTFLSTDLRWSTWGNFLKDDFSPGDHQRADYQLIRFKCLKLFDKGVPLNLRHFYRCIFNSDVDVVHCVGLATPITLAVLAAASGRRKRPRILVSDHSNTMTAKRTGRAATAYQLAMKMTLGRVGHTVDEFITYSTDSRDFVSQRFGVSPERFRVIPLGFDDTVFHCEQVQKGASKKALHVGFAGKIDENKRLDRLISACATSKFSGLIRLTLAGASADRNSPLIARLRTMASELGVSLTILPLLTPSELAALYNSLHLAVFPGSISVTTIEASACGVPILLNRSIDGLENRVSEGRGRLFDTNEELVELIDAQLSAGPVEVDERRLIAENTRKSFAWSSVVHKYLDAYRAAG